MSDRPLANDIKIKTYGFDVSVYDWRILGVQQVDAFSNPTYLSDLLSEELSFLEIDQSTHQKFPIFVRVGLNIAQDIPILQPWADHIPITEDRLTHNEDQIGCTHG